MQTSDWCYIAIIKFNLLPKQKKKKLSCPNLMGRVFGNNPGDRGLIISWNAWVEFELSYLDVRLNTLTTPPLNRSYLIDRYVPDRWLLISVSCFGLKSCSFFVYWTILGISTYGLREPQSNDNKSCSLHYPGRQKWSLIICCSL